MLSRILDPRDGRPRDPAFWLVLAAVGCSLLLAFWLVCQQQVSKAQERRSQAYVERVASGRCVPPSPGSALPACPPGVTPVTLR